MWTLLTWLSLHNLFLTSITTSLTLHIIHFIQNNLFKITGFWSRASHRPRKLSYQPLTTHSHQTATRHSSEQWTGTIFLADLLSLKGPFRTAAKTLVFSFNLTSENMNKNNSNTFQIQKNLTYFKFRIHNNITHLVGKWFFGFADCILVRIFLIVL